MATLELELQGISIDQHTSFPTNNLDLAQVPFIAGAPTEVDHFDDPQGTRCFPPDVTFDFNTAINASSIWAECSPSTGARSSIGFQSPATSTATSGRDETIEPTTSSSKRQPMQKGPFRCSHPGCTKSWPTRAKLSQHKRYHTKQLSCRRSGGSCDEVFSIRSDLRRHQMHERGDIVMCPRADCKRPRIRGKRKDNLKRHLKNVHKLGQPRAPSEHFSHNSRSELHHAGLPLDPDV
ncbi:hypothetical protein QBC34DRAFT_425458 [Podospora aff. communis PSN243]|uniref:C2H2-type domain-containing protein n=1 Tax=Podospora aff. communis PSN243 TaxID=3040156 RepID=A0AAV9GSR3_9PEZI|nr:hypothetical protein QBC34DRAFT_425458 [Podospora aff. communis PSN243]